MSFRPKALIAWSTGKDSAWALHQADEELLRTQLEAAELPAIVVRIPYPCSNEIYERKMAAAMDETKAAGVTHVIFGDLFLEDVRAYRER